MESNSNSTDYEYFNNTLPRVFDSLDELVTAAKSMASSKMILLFKRKSDKEKVVLACSHGNKYRSTRGAETGDDTQRRSSTIKTECPFRINGRKSVDGKWNLNLTNVSHNHPLPVSLVEIANARRDSNSQRDEILRLSNANVRSRQIVHLFEESNLIIRKDIYNIIAAEKRKKLQNRSVLEYLLDNLLEPIVTINHF
jgi:hypothetical protein